MNVKNNLNQRMPCHMAQRTEKKTVEKRVFNEYYELNRYVEWMDTLSKNDKVGVTLSLDENGKVIVSDLLKIDVLGSEDSQ